MNKIDKRAIKFSAQTILEIPFSSKRGAAILKTSVFGTLITFCSLLHDLLAIFKSKNISIVFLFKSSLGKKSHSGNSLYNFIFNSIFLSTTIYTILGKSTSDKETEDNSFREELSIS